MALSLSVPVTTRSLPKEIETNPEEGTRVGRVVAADQDA